MRSCLPRAALLPVSLLLRLSLSVQSWLQSLRALSHSLFALLAAALLRERSRKRRAETLRWKRQSRARQPPRWFSLARAQVW